MSDQIERVLVCGAGTMGAWITAEAAASGLETFLFDRDEAALARVAPPTRESRPATLSRVLDERIVNVDVVIECIPEDAALKRDLFHRLDELCPPHTLLTSNTSILHPDAVFAGVKRRDRLACLHFYRPRTAVEIMPLPETSEETLIALTGLARRMGEVPIRLRKVSPGYVGSRLLGAALDQALDLVAREVVVHRDVDRCWMAVTGMPIGPFGIVDQVGLDTSLAIRRSRLTSEPHNTDLLMRGLAVLEAMVKEGRLGLKSGHGFYEYPNPEYARSEFLSKPE